MSTQFSSGPTRNVQPGDTPDLNDGLLSRSIDAANIQRGVACFIKAGIVTIAAVADALAGYTAFVPIESVDNSGGAPGDLEASGVTANQRVALEVLAGSATLNPGDYVKISATPGLIELFVVTTDVLGLKYARYLGKEAALLDRNTASPYDETLTPGVVPDQALAPVTGDNVGWFQLVESQGGA
jgi:hypothetical protein